MKQNLSPLVRVRSTLNNVILPLIIFFAVANPPLHAATKSYLNGEWQISGLKETGSGPHSIVAELQKKIQAQNLSFTFKAEADVGVFKLVSQTENENAAGTCTVTLPYDVGYCCIRMQKLFLYSSVDQEPTEEPAGCAEAHFGIKQSELVKQLEEILYPVFHYYVAGERLNKVLLDGPYAAPSLQMDWGEIKLTFLSHSSMKRFPREGFAANALYPRPKGQGFTARLIKIHLSEHVGRPDLFD